MGPFPAKRWPTTVILRILARQPSEVYKFASERVLTIMSIFLSGCMLTRQLPSTLMHVVIIPLLNYKSKDPADVNNYWPIIAIATALSKVLEQVLLSPLWAGICGLQTANLVSSEHMGQKGHICTQANTRFLP